MRFLLFSDVHGNLQALEAVLRINDGAQFDGIYCLGDLVSGGADGNDVIDLLSHYRVECLMGNHDQFLITPDHGLFPRWAEKYVFALLAWEKQHLSAAAMHFLRTLPNSISLDAGPQSKMLLCHATPVSPWSLDVLQMSASDADMEAHYGTTRADLVFHGHDHTATGVRFWREKTIVNIASVGGRTDGTANYTIVETEPNQIMVSQRSATYDISMSEKRMDELMVPRLKDYLDETQ
ncbi:MAG: metallophosphoesterase [Anaerolineae bacterium]|nr:metallophosphoesterase [Anaerolineae bacterium]